MSSKSTTYPRTAYTLTRNYNVRKVTLVRPYSQISNTSGYTARGVFYSERDLFETPKAAIKAGRAQLKRRKKSLEAGLLLIASQNTALDKAEGTAAQAATDTDKEG